jgi:hypothetical protein
VTAAWLAAVTLPWVAQVASVIVPKSFAMSPDRRA